MDFYKHLNYSLGNEDWSVEEQALQVNPGDKVVCVTASGDRPLHLLMTDCAAVTSIDMNHIQNHLLHLKIAAISELDYEKYIAFLGCTPATDRYAIFNQIKNNLPVDTASFWEQHRKMIERGVVYQGRLERLEGIVAKIFNLLRKKKNSTLLAFDDINLQREFVAKEWNTPMLNKAFEVLINPRISKFILNDPGLHSYIEYSNNKPGKYIYDRMLDYLNNNLAKNSPLLQLLFTGKITSETYFPYLTFAGYSKIRRNTDRLKCITGNVVEFLHQHSANTVDCFSLSDVASYMPQQIFEKLLAGLQHAGKPNARFCLREFISKRHIPSHLATVFKRNSSLEQKLEKEESNFVYRFMVGEIQK